MKKATKLMEILSANYTKIIPEKYAKLILQVATLEERIKTLMDFGMMDKSMELNGALVDLLEEVKREYLKDTNGNG